MPAKFDVSAVFVTAERLAAEPKVIETAIQRSISTVTRDVVPEVSRDIRQTYNVPAQRLGSELRSRHTADAIEVIASGDGIGLVAYGARDTASGVVVTVRKDRGPTLLRHNFIRAPRAGGSGRQVFERGLIGGRRAPRNPLERGFGQNAAGMVREPARGTRLAGFVFDRLAAEIQRNIGVLRGNP